MVFPLVAGLSRTPLTENFPTDFLMELNREIRLFAEQEVREAMQNHSEASVDQQPEWSMASNIILAHCVRNQSQCQNVAEYTKYFNGSLAHVPRIILGNATSLEVSSLMAMVHLYISSLSPADKRFSLLHRFCSVCSSEKIRQPSSCSV